MRICNVVLAWNRWSVFRNLDENHAFFHSFVRGHWAYGKNAILELECAFYLTFGTFLEVCIRFFFFTFTVSSCVKPAGIIVQVQEICFIHLHSPDPLRVQPKWQKMSGLLNSTNTKAIKGTSNMCATSTMSLHPTPPTPPQPHVLRSIQHVCNFNDVFTPHPTHPPQPHVLRSIQHVCNFNDVITPHPTHPPNPTHVTGVKENAFLPPFTAGEARSETRRYVRLEPKTNEFPISICVHHEDQVQVWEPLRWSNIFTDLTGSCCMRNLTIYHRHGKPVGEAKLSTNMEIPGQNPKTSQKTWAKVRKHLLGKEKK